MWKQSSPHIDHEKLDRFGEELLQALEVSDSEINLAAASPFLYRRILVRIETERKRRAEEWNRWLALLKETWHAIPVFAIIAIIVATLVWQASAQIVQPPPAASNRSSMQLTLAGEILLVSGDEVITSMVGWSEHSSAQRKEQ